MGSLLAAVASFLDARANKGVWLLRMEDLDPPREPEGAADQILHQLESLQLLWDERVLYQSTRLDAYQTALEELRAKDLCFQCTCTRQRLKTLAGVYDGHCRPFGADAHSQKSRPSATRLRVTDQTCTFTDRIQGEYSQHLLSEVGDFVIKRKDGLFAYQLAVVVDDEEQEITDIVRGYDLLDSTPRQLYLQESLGYGRQRYAHFPVIINSEGQKLSKQHFAPAIDPVKGCELLLSALHYLGQNPDPTLAGSDCETVLNWGIENWDIQAVPKLASIPESELYSGN